MTKLSRRAILLTPVAVSAARAVSAAGKMTLAMHQNTSAGAGYRKSLEGWARAGITQVEITNTLLDDFLKTDSLAAARRVLADLGQTAVQGGTGVTGLWEPNPDRLASLVNLKKRCEMYAALGLNRVYATTGTAQKVTLDDYKLDRTTCMRRERLQSSSTCRCGSNSFAIQLLSLLCRPCSR